MNIAQIVTPYFRNFISFAVCVIVALGAVSAQTDAMLQVSGTIKDEDSGRKLPGHLLGRKPIPHKLKRIQMAQRQLK